MSVNHIDKSTGDLIRVAGQGKAEYGASTERKGDIVVPATTAGFFQSVSVVFAQSMPDNDYAVVIDEGGNTWAHCSVNVTSKTVTGFTLFFYNAAGTDAPQMTFKYRAFKLYTDTEYNNLLNNAVLTSDVTDAVTSGDMNPVTSNAVAEALEVEDLTSQITMSNGTDGKPLFTRGSGRDPWDIFSCIRYGKMVVFSVCYRTFSGKLTSGTICFSGLPKAIAPAECGGSFDTRWFIDINGTVKKLF